MFKVKNQFTTKTAAPESQRGFWSRLFSSPTSERGKLKDFRLEMDNILDGIMNISHNAQQLRNAALRLRQYARTSQDFSQILPEIDSLTSENWNQVVDAINNINRSVNSLPNNPNTIAIREISREIIGNVQQIYDNIAKTQRNMNYLRSRLSGQKSMRSLGDEYGSLNVALNRLYQNPLDERSIFYSQKLHGKLEDAVQGWENVEDDEFTQWSNQDNFEESHEETPTTTEYSAAPIGNNPDEITNSIVDNLVQLGDVEVLTSFLNALTEVSQGSEGSSQEHNAINAIRSKLQEKIMAMGEADPGPYQNQENVESKPMKSEDSDTLFGVQNYGNELSRPFDKNEFNKNRVASRIETFIRLADIIDKSNPEIANLIDEYIKENGEKSSGLPKFPRKATVTKD